MLTTRFYSALALIALTLLVVVGPRFVGAIFALALWGLSLYELYKITQPFKWHVYCGYAAVITASCLGIIYLKWELWPGDMWLLLVFLMTWAHDVGGYIFGKIFDGPKVWPSVSPNKTWAGIGGGIFLGIVVNWACGLFEESGMPSLGLLAIILLNFIGISGDLLESKIKRIYNQKDSGNLIPGHGGVLDRFDSFHAINLAMLIMYIK